jgi:hypothetical protein
MSQYHDYGNIETFLRRGSFATEKDLFRDVFKASLDQEDEQGNIIGEVFNRLEGEELMDYIYETLVDPDLEFKLTVFEEESLELVLEKN